MSQERIEQLTGIANQLRILSIAPTTRAGSGVRFRAAPPILIRGLRPPDPLHAHFSGAPGPRAVRVGAALRARGPI
jgi:hypothetical protein